MKNLTLIRKTTRCLFICFALVISTQVAYSSEMWNDGSKSFVSHIGDGYIDLVIPFYDEDGNDEALVNTTDNIVSSVWIYNSANSNDYYPLIYFYSADGEDSWQSAGSHWIKTKRNSSYTAKVIAISGRDSHDIGTGYSGGIYFGNSSEVSSATYRIYLSNNLLASGKSFQVHVKYYVDTNSDGNGASTERHNNVMSFTMPSFSSPVINFNAPGFSSTAGKYELSFNVTAAKDGSKYRWDNSDLSGATTGSSATTQFDVQNYQQNHNLYFWYKVSDYQMVMKYSSKILPAYQQPLNFTASNEPSPSGADTKLTWTVSGSQTEQQTGDEFEIQRSTDAGFTSPVTVGKIAYNPTTTYYSIIDKTSEENLNTTVYYRIRRTKATQWNWSFSKTVSIVKSMSHITIKQGSVTEQIDENNQVTVNWLFDTGNVISTNSKIIIKRTRLDNQQVDIIEKPFDSNTKSYSEELTAMCKEYHYSVYVVPGNSKYTTQNPVEARPLNSIVPVNFGNITALTASKGYFSDRVELEWNLVDGAAETFSIQRRLYGSTEEFKQLDTKPAFESSHQYSYTDVTSTPGVLYEYRIAGMTSCATGLSTVYSPPTVGFRTPTGDIYGRVTFENGQAEEGVEINVTTEEDILSQSVAFTANDSALVTKTTLLQANTNFISLQAYVSPDATNGTILSKNGMYSLGISNDQYYFSAGNKTVTIAVDSLRASVLKTKASWVHVSGIYTGTKLLIYLNGDSITQTDGVAVITENTNSVKLGGNGFVGKIDEVRIWNKALTTEEIKRDYNRYIPGNETSLLAYYTFNYATNTEFYDISYYGTNYNANHGVLNTASVTNDSPTASQLGYKGVTRTDGSYEVRTIPYKGNGTAYYLVPKLGIHQFESEKEVRFISAQAQSHTVNFTDKSSFTVKGTVTYSNSIIPVEGVNFTVDGVTVVKSNGIPEATAADGSFSIMVPVGVHEVKAVKPNHKFENEGRITDPNGVDLNYQDDINNVLLKDKTTIKYIGRVAGGTVQEAYPLGHSLSKNNLANGITITLQHTKIETLTFNDATITEPHLKPSNATTVHTNDVVYGENKVVIHVNDTTGEFVAHLIPEQFTVTVNAGTHHVDIPGSGSTIDLSQQFIEQKIVNAYTDSIKENNQWKKVNYSDTVRYNFAQKFIKRYAPEIRVSQTDANKKLLPYFGNDTILIPNMIGEQVKVPLYDSASNTYTFDKPVFVHNASYHLKMEVFEKYQLFNGDELLTTDEVPTQDATFKFNNDIATIVTKNTEVEADSVGVGYYSFVAAEPELTSGIRSINLKVTYGDNASPTSIDWEQPTTFANGEAFVLGAHQTGTDFVTAGPDKVLTVLRDPPGSNSFSYLEKGVTVTESSTYTGSIKNTGNENFTLGVKAEVVVFAGLGAGVINKTVETESGVTVGIIHEEQYEGQDTKKSVTTTTTRFQTSDDPNYVGPYGDVYIGYSTNITFGSTQNVTIVPKSKLAAYTGTHYKEVADWALVYAEGRSVSQSFSTLFAYPQIHIEQQLIPELQTIRNNILKETIGFTPEQLQTAANNQGKVFYYSYLPADNPDFGKSNEDATISNKTYGTASDVFDGPSYKIIAPTNNPSLSVSDTIVYLNQSIQAWKNRMADNEKAKVEAELLQNYSFQGGANIEYSESYASSMAHQSSFYINIGGKISNDTYIGAGVGPKTKFEFEESLETQHGGTWNSEVEASHSKGFVLADEGADRISVDVCYEKGWSKSDEEYTSDGNGGMVDADDLNSKKYYPSFIFKTKAGATSCPYEGQYKTKYYEPGIHTINEATKRIEVPEIDMKNKFVENVPSGETAKLTLYLRNNSETNDDAWFDLKLLDASNPNGARFNIDGGALGNGRSFLVPAGETLIKTLEVGKGRVLNYDDLQLCLQSQCQYDPTNYLEDIADTITFTVHFIPSCSNVAINKPANNWTYNTKLPTVEVNGVDKHYMEVQINEFDVNYDNFGWIELQYKSASQSDEQWTTLMNYYNDTTLYNAAIQNGLNCEMIKASDAGTIRYNFFMDDMPDQKYDIRATSICIINNEEVRNASEIVSGLKDMYCPRLFGSAQPADGVLDIEDEIRLNFNEQIADGLLTKNNFQVRGVRNGTVSDHSTSLRFDGLNDYLDTEFAKNLQDKSLTVEMWVQPKELQNGTLFSHGNKNESFELALTADECLQVKVGETIVKSPKLGQTPANPNYADGSWAHIAMIYDADSNKVSAYYNYTEVISRAPVTTPYSGIGNFVLGKSIASESDNYAGKMHNVRVWEKQVTESNLQLNSLIQLAGIEQGLVAYYPMNEGRGETSEDKARGATMIMHGTEWAMPDGFAAHTNGADYLKIDASTAAFTKEMDYTIEFWFKADEGQTNATILSAGSGELNSIDADYGFAIGFDANGKLTFTSNGIKTSVEGEYRDNNWHHFAIAVNRTIGRAQLYINGKLSTFIDATTVGGIASDYFFVGARGWYDSNNAATLIVDNYFKGSVDDLRFWDLYRNERIVNENNNVKLTGEELGLIHYYPFDTYIEYMGQKYVDFTNKDMHISKTANPETDQFAIIGATIDNVKSKDIAPLKDAGPIADLDFDFVVNNDALIITLKEAEYKIAKTIITFTVNDVRDVNGNSVVSPITWSAYIDRNQLRWETDRLDIDKAVYEPYEFTVKAVNNSGAVRNYTITNAPSWLEVSPNNGAINPKSYDIITFTINDGLNVGSYNEVVYLTNDDGVAEPLALNITVQGEKPSWTVNPAAYKYNMSIYGKMRFNNIFSADKNDILAAFKNGQCIGVATSSYNKTLDMWYALLTVYANEKQLSDLEFRMWDASTGKTYLAIPDEQIIFINDGIVGNVADPVFFDGKEIFYNSISLQNGWNWISFNLANENLVNVNKTLSNGSWTSNDVVKNQDYFDSYSTTYGWKGTLSLNNGFNNTAMFMLHASNIQKLSTSGTAVPIKNTAIAIKGNQWNAIGYLPSTSNTVKEALAGYDAKNGDVIKSQSAFAMYYNNEWIGSLEFMEPNKGYMLKRTAQDNVQFYYPATGGSLNSRKARMPHVSYCNRNYAKNMNMVATCNNMQQGDTIQAYVNGELRGVGQYAFVNNNAVNFISISGEGTNDIVSFDLKRNGEVIGTSSTIINYRSDAIQGSVTEPFVLDFSLQKDNVTVYPSPFEKQFMVAINTNEAASIEITIFDMNGHKIYSMEPQQKQAGVYQITVDGSTYISGVYLLNIRINNNLSVYKIQKK
ncbi:MAG: T9SS type A sorting domain-containing protein [Paludibacteraceae bacterium]|nr:T9SS type A sorting domain-containing protein [Paludibacteraceae bacterium]MBN2786813.1 T9SS type A sorting domain-containing protein [Paludibacteraceae bacterium]